MKARTIWRTYSAILSAALATACGVFVALPDAQQTAILAAVGVKPALVPLIGFLAVLVVRFIPQPALHEGDKP